MLGKIPGSFTEKILCAIGEPAILFNDDIRICWANPSAEMFFGHSSEYMNGKKCSQLFRQHVECMERCPVHKAFHSGIEQVLAVDSIDGPEILIEAVPIDGDDARYVLSIIHSPPENQRDSALKRDLAAALNTRENLVEAADTILDAVGVLAFVNRKGIYILCRDCFRLVRGSGVPDRFPADSLSGRVHGELFYLEKESAGPGGGGLALPVSDRVFILAGRGSWGSKSRAMLELVGEVLAGCVERLTSSAVSIP